MDTSQTPFRESPDYKGNTLFALNAALIVITTVIVGLRLYVRSVSNTLGVDDLLAFLGYV